MCTWHAEGLAPHARSNPCHQGQQGWTRALPHVRPLRHPRRPSRLERLMTEEDKEPDEQELPDKPPIEDMPPEDGLDPPTDEEEAEHGEVKFMSPEEADEDDTVDNQESHEEQSLGDEEQKAGE